VRLSERTGIRHAATFALRRVLRFSRRPGSARRAIRRPRAETLHGTKLPPRRRALSRSLLERVSRELHARFGTACCFELRGRSRGSPRGTNTALSRGAAGRAGSRRAQGTALNARNIL